MGIHVANCGLGYKCSLCKKPNARYRLCTEDREKYNLNHLCGNCTRTFNESVASKDETDSFERLRPSSHPNRREEHTTLEDREQQEQWENSERETLEDMRGIHLDDKGGLDKDALETSRKARCPVRFEDEDSKTRTQRKKDIETEFANDDRDRQSRVSSARDLNRDQNSNKPAVVADGSVDWDSASNKSRNRPRGTDESRNARNTGSVPKRVLGHVEGPSASRRPSAHTDRVDKPSRSNNTSNIPTPSPRAARHRGNDTRVDSNASSQPSMNNGRRASHGGFSRPRETTNSPPASPLGAFTPLSYEAYIDDEGFLQVGIRPRRHGPHGGYGSAPCPISNPHSPSFSPPRPPFSPYDMRGDPNLPPRRGIRGGQDGPFGSFGGSDVPEPYPIIHRQNRPGHVMKFSDAELMDAWDAKKHIMVGRMAGGNWDPLIVIERPGSDGRARWIEFSPAGGGQTVVIKAGTAWGSKILDIANR